MSDGPRPYLVPDPADEAGHPAVIAARLMLHEEHQHLVENEITIEYLMAADNVHRAGKQVIGAVHLPTVQGRLKSLFEMLLGDFFGELPDFLMVIDLAWWEEASAIDREALIWHELCHVRQEIDQYGALKFDQDGNPKYGLREHDVTSFNSEVARYGAWSPDLQQFFAAAGK